MKKQYTRLIVSVSFLLVTAVSCNKNERAFKHLMDGGRWEVTELSAGSTAYTKLPKWQITPCDNHETYCLATWEHQNGSSTGFYWRFTNLGGNFDFHVDPQESETLSMAFSQCYNFSGEYDVIESKRKRFRFESYSTAGYPDKRVIIQLEKQ